MEETVLMLCESYPVGIVTSRLRQSVQEVEHLGNILHLLKTVVTYEDTQEHKPHPEPLLLAAKNLGFPTEECVYIGDAETDLQAAEAAGMQFINYGKKELPEAKIWTDDFSKIPELIENL